VIETIGVGYNSIGRAELAALAAVVTHDHTHIATDCLTPLHQITNFPIYDIFLIGPHHVQGDILKILSYSIRNSQSHTFLDKFKSLAEIASIECGFTASIGFVFRFSVQTSLPNTKPAMGTFRELNSLPAVTTIHTAGLVTPSFMLDG